ncbi:MAG TPA: septation protein SepH, partial [Dermatophilaceae bacterium]|nr:septation protein SepH [Dermatophilaceae bacterium]
MTTRPQPTHGVSMQDLRLIGVDDDGGHLLLASVDGARFRVPLDESLRAAARRDRPRLGQLQIEIEGGMRPRDVQAMVRAGMSADEVAERSGWTVEKVHKYEGPILAEREYVAGLGRAVRLRQRGGSGPSTTLGQRVADRLTARGVEADSIEWDAWRREGPEWTVAVNFSAGGRVRQGTWAFDVASRSLHAKDDEARWLSEDEP